MQIIYSTASAVSSSDTNAADDNDMDDGLSGEAVAGTVIGVLVGVGLVAGWQYIYQVVQKKKKASFYTLQEAGALHSNVAH